jgi:hypothetical protein
MRAPLLMVLGLVACTPSNGGVADDDGPSDDAGGDDDGGDDDSSCPCPDGGGGDGGGNPGCDGSGSTAAQPFGNHGHSYADGVILPSHRSQEALDDAVRGYYNAWAAEHLKQGCGEGRYYVDVGIDSAMTVSEAHGYGMMVLAYMAGHDPDAKTKFDGMFHYYKDHPSEIESTLMAWSQADSCANNQGATSATDGDLDIAYALLLADKQWSSGGAIDYKAEADALIAGIERGEVDASGSYLRLGDWTSEGSELYDATRSSDFMPQHLASFAAATGDTTWTNIADTTYGIISDVQTGFASSTGLIPDFIVSPLSNPRPAGSGLLEGANDGKYAYNACRDPWRIATDYVVNGDSRAKTIVQRINAWVKDETGGDPSAVTPGYNLNGTAIGNPWYDTAFTAPFGVAAMVDGAHQDWLNAVWDEVSANHDSGYYGDTINMLSLIVMSGNWWSPEAAPCP